MNHLDESELAAWRGSLIERLHALLEGKVSVIAGVRQVLALANEQNPRSRDFDLFAAIDSETDHLPLESARATCTAAWLAQCDLQAQEVQNQFGPAVREHAELLLIKLRGSQ